MLLYLMNNQDHTNTKPDFKMNKKITPKPTSNFVNETLIKLAVKNKNIADILIDYSPRNKEVINKARKKQKK